MPLKTSKVLFKFSLLSTLGYQNVYTKLKKCLRYRTLWVPDTDVKKHERKLKARFKSSKTVDQTRLNHC